MTMEARLAPRGGWEKNSARPCYDFQNSAGGAPVTWFYPIWEESGPEMKKVSRTVEALFIYSLESLAHGKLIDCNIGCPLNERQVERNKKGDAQLDSKFEGGSSWIDYLDIFH